MKIGGAFSLLPVAGFVSFAEKGGAHAMDERRIDNLLQEIHESRGDLFPIIARLREIVLASGHEIKEEVKYGGIVFSSQKIFCGVYCYKAHVTLEFDRGASLPDPHGVLEGNGKHRRNIKFLRISEIEEKRVAEYVQMAEQAADT